MNGVDPLHRTRIGETEKNVPILSENEVEVRFSVCNAANSIFLKRKRCDCRELEYLCVLLITPQKEVNCLSLSGREAEYAKRWFPDIC